MAHPANAKIAMRAVSGFREPISTLQVLARHPHSCNPTSERIENTSSREPPRPEMLMLFTFPEDAHWNAGRQAVEFGVETGAVRGLKPHCSFGSKKLDSTAK